MMEDTHMEAKQSATPGLKLSLAISPEARPDELAFARQLGVECVYTWVHDDQRDLAYLKTLRQKVEDAGLMLWMTGNFSVGKSDKIHLALPGRDQMIADFQAFVTNLGQAGIRVTTFTWEPTQVWSSEPGETRTAKARRVDLEEMRRRPWTHGRIYTEDELWDNFAYFMQRIIPAAEAAGVRLALHPNDPPTDMLGGIPCLIRSAAAYCKAFQIANSPALGMEFCAGCWLEGGKDFGNILEGIREFQAQGRILIVHFRNISAPLPQFVETFLDNGYMDMYAVMRALVDSGYCGTVTLDHTPQFAGEYAKGGGAAYAVGYMKALLQCIEKHGD
jgi:mannonate dehydratase